MTGDVSVGSGSLTANGGVTVTGELKAEGGNLTVGGESTLGSVSGNFTGLEIEKDGTLTVQKGKGLTADSFTWGSDSTLSLGKRFKGTLDFGKLTGTEDDRLTLDLSSEFLDQLESGDTFFKDVTGYGEGWNGLFDFTINGRSIEEFRNGYYNDLHITADGTLAWSEKEHGPDYTSSEDNIGNKWNTNGKNIYDSVGDYRNVIVDKDTNISFAGADVNESKGVEQWSVDGLTVHNLQGGEKGVTLTITGDRGPNNKVTLRNTSVGEHDLTYAGGLTVVGAELHISHEDTDPDSLDQGAVWSTVMGGNLDLSGGMGLFMDRGVLELQGGANKLTNVTFTNDCDGQLVVNGGAATVSGNIVLGSEEAVYTKDADGKEVTRDHVRLENGGVLELDGITVGAGVTIGGDDSDNVVRAKGNVSMEKGSKLSGAHLVLAGNTVLDVGKGETEAASDPFSIYGIQSDGGHLTGNRDMNIAVQGDHRFTGSMEGYSGKMSFTSQVKRIEDIFMPPTQRFTQVTTGSRDWDMEVGSGAHVELNVLNSEGKNAGWEMGDITLRAGSTTTLGFTFSSDGVKSATETGMSFTGFLMEDGATLTLRADGDAMPTGTEFVLGKVVDGGEVDLHWSVSKDEESAEGEAKGDNGGEELAAAKAAPEPRDQVNPNVLELQKDNLEGNAWLHVESAKIVHKGDQIKLVMEMIKGNALADAVQGVHENATEGAKALWQLTDTVNNPKGNENLNDRNSDTSKLVSDATSLLDGENKSELAKLLASAAGAGYTGYTAALGEDMHRQLTAIRNRTTSMGDESRSARDEDLPYWHAWLNAESSVRDLDADGLAPGYRLNGWGGTFGADADISSNTTVGLALTAMYNDLKCTGADSISGDMDTMYATAFLRHMSGRWTHTFVLSGGTADFKTHRTVMTGSGNYKADADTSGYSVGALYEIGYTTMLSKDSRSGLQYVFNVEARYNSIDGFSESGSDAGLSVDDMDSTALTFGAGARLQTLFGENVYNRSALFEARVLVKADAGDRRGEAATRFLNGSTTTNMVGAEVGVVGVELGAGITVPVGPSSSSGSFFIDGSVEFRQGWTSFDATAGYRISF